MSDIPTADALRSSLKAMVVEVAALDEPADSIQDDEQLIGGRLDLNSLDAIEIAAAVDYEYGVRIEDVRGARAIMRSIEALATHVETEKGWRQA